MNNGNGKLRDEFEGLGINDGGKDNNNLFKVFKAVEAAETIIRLKEEENKRLKEELQKRDQEVEHLKIGKSVAHWHYLTDSSDENRQGVHRGPQMTPHHNSLGGQTADNASLSQNSSHISFSLGRYPKDEENDSRIDVPAQGLMSVIESNNPDNLWKQITEHEREIIHLRKHLTDFSIKESQLRNEKLVLEKRIAHMRMAFDQQQQDVVDAASKALSYRQDVIEENVRLTYALQEAQQERTTFVSSLLPLLAEYSLQPQVSDAQSIVSNIKVLFKHLQEKLIITESKLKESQYQLTPWRSDGMSPNFVPQSPELSSGAALTSSKIGLELVPRPTYSPANLVNSNGQAATDWDSRGQHAFQVCASSPMQSSELDNIGRLSPFENRESDVHDAPAEVASSHDELHATQNKQVKFKNPVSSSEVYAADVEGHRNEIEHAESWGSGTSPYSNTFEDPSSSYSPYLQPVPEEPYSSFSEAADDDDPLPAIEDLQISGEPSPGQQLQAGGYSINGTTCCNFEWVRHMEDGSVKYIDGAKQPIYLVTADDVDTYLAIEVQPLDDRNRKGELVKVFANEHNKIVCDPAMHSHIEQNLRNGHVSYKVSLSANFLQIWEPAILTIKREGYSIKGSGTSSVSISEKLSSGITVSISHGHGLEFSIFGSNGAEHLLRADDIIADIASVRDAIVLTLRKFVTKVSLHLNESQYEGFEAGGGSGVIPGNDDNGSDDDLAGGDDDLAGGDDDLAGGDEEVSTCSESTDYTYGPTDSDEEEETHVPRDHFVYGEIGEELEDSDVSEKWDGNPESIGFGTIFKSKEAVQNGIAVWSAKRGVTYKNVDSRKTSWAVECTTRGRNYPTELLHEGRCSWSIRASEQVGGKWKMVKWVNTHSCLGSSMVNQSKNITSRDIAALVIPKVRIDPGYKVKFVQSDVAEHYHVNVSYKKAWHGRRKAIEAVYGSWISNFMDLPRYMAAVEARNPGTVVQWRFEDGTEHHQRRIFKYVFWSFGACINAFKECMPVISVDGTHLRGAYKGKLLVAVCKTANNNIMPLAYALADTESVDSWTWFLHNLKLHVMGERRTCIISDRHPGIVSAMETLLQYYPDMGVHRFCLEHVKRNLLKDCGGKKGLKGLCQLLGSELQEHKYYKAWNDLRHVSVRAANYLEKIEPEMWTLYGDGCNRWGMTTTNISESFNNVLKGARHLPIRAIVEASLEKTAAIFSRDWARIRECHTTLAPSHLTRYEKDRLRALRHKIIDWSDGGYCFSVQTMEGNKHEVKFNERVCTCGKWQTRRMPCSHAIAVAVFTGGDPVALVDRCYKIDGWRAQFSGKLFPVLGCHSWPELNWELKQDDIRLVHYSGPGRKKQNRYKSSTERNTRSGRTPRVCGRCGNIGHTVKKCPISHPPSDRAASGSIYDQYGEHGL